MLITSTHRGRGSRRLLVAALLAGGLALPVQLAQAAGTPWTSDARIDVAVLPASHGPAPEAVDWDEDGDLDLVVGLREVTQHGGIAVYLRQADGSLPAEPASVWTAGSSPLKSGERSFRPAVADWNGDGKKDLLYGQQSTYFRGVVACLNQGTDALPVFRAGSSTCVLLRAGAHITGHPVGTGNNEGSSPAAYTSPEVVDWDADGDPDLLVGTAHLSSPDRPEVPGVRLYRSTGRAANGMPVLAAPVDVVTPQTPGLEGERAFEPAAADMDGDGLLDLLVAGDRVGTTGYVSRVHTCTNQGSAAEPSFGRCTSTSQTGLLYNALDVADWDGDGVLDQLRGYFAGLQANPVTMLHGKGPDGDSDGISDSIDNCVSVSNPARVKLNRDNAVQLDNDGDGLGDPCDGDLDGDGVSQAEGDTCAYRPDADQGDVDGDGRGDLCDPRDDRPTAYGVGSEAWEMAERTGWGRKPVVIMRADAMSIGYRQEIAERLTREALDRGLPMSLAMIPWDDSRLRRAPATSFVRANAADPLLEVVQHGTYHVCVVEGRPAVGEEFGPVCGMDESESYNLMKVGKDAMDAVLAPVTPSHALTGFIPPADAANAAAQQAAQSLGYSYFASAYYAEPRMFHTDETGMVHVPWSQIACGNGAASWTDCSRTSVSAHSGVDCADPALCTPTRGPSAQHDYTDWQQHADTRLAERCRGDFGRYGVCSILFELTSYDADFSRGVPDERAMSAFSLTLDELEQVAREEGAVFLTVGQYAASQRAVDEQAPTIEVLSPTPGVHGAAPLQVDVDVTDAVSGVHEVAISVDGRPVADGAELDPALLGEGEHVLAVRAEDEAGNVSEQEVRFVLDLSGPVVTVVSPVGSYGHEALPTVDVSASDEPAGVASVEVLLDGRPVETGTRLDLARLALGDHELLVRAVDRVGNRTERREVVTVTTSIATLRALVDRFAAEGAISDGTATSLRAKLEAAADSQAAGRPGTAANQVHAFAEQVRAQRGTHIAPAEADVLRTDAEAVVAALRREARAPR